MRLTKTASVEELQVASRFEGLRRMLLGEEYAEHRQKPLAYWALPTDRRLPLAFLGRTLQDLLTTPLAELSNTPGIGQKKMCAFVTLLARAANTDPAELPGDAACAVPETAGAAKSSTNGQGFDPAAVSEVLWSQWRAGVLKHGLENEPLGRFAPSLRHMTRVIWSTPLGAYTNRTLAEIRALKTHGEKRLHAILEVFYSLHVLAGGMGTQKHLAVRVVPARIDRVEQWIGRVLQTPGIPPESEISENLVGPLLDQVRDDATRQIASLAENRLGIGGPITSVRQAARTLGLTRARIYQLLNEINDILAVRWPLGRHQMYELCDRFRAESAEMAAPPALEQFHAAVELFFPGNRRGAAGPLDHLERDAEAEFFEAEAEPHAAEHLVGAG